MIQLNRSTKGKGQFKTWIKCSKKLNKKIENLNKSNKNIGEN
jgi:hypothetical protein